MTAYTQKYQLRYADWQSRKRGDDTARWSVRAWLESCCNAIEDFARLARGTETESFGGFENWCAVTVFDELAFYGLYGAVIGEPEPGEARAAISKLMQNAERMISCGMPGDDTVPLSIIELARSRMAIDLKEGVIDVASLAILAGLSTGRVQNIMSGKDAALSSVGGRVPAKEAAMWLEGRSAFWPSIWCAPRSASNSGEKIRVPVASDGTIFHPALRRRNGYMIGEKGSEQVVDQYNDALSVLYNMREPRWRRPNPKGNWGIVKGTNWAFINREELEALKL